MYTTNVSILFHITPKTLNVYTNYYISKNNNGMFSCISI